MPSSRCGGGLYERVSLMAIQLPRRNNMHRVGGTMITRETCFICQVSMSSYRRYPGGDCRSMREVKPI